MKVMILGDLHIGKGLSIGKSAEFGSLNSRIQDQIDILNWVYDLCIEDKDLNNIIITGDVYQDYRPHPAVISIFMRWLKKCEFSNIKVHIIMGNHDIIRSGQWITSALDLVSHLELPNATVYKNFESLEIGDFFIVFMPFRDKRMYDSKVTEESLLLLKEDISKTYSNLTTDKIKVGIGHLAIEGSLSIGDEISDQLNELYVPSEMFDWFDYVWMGHIHHPQIIQHKEPYIAHIGSLDRSDFSKTEVDSEKIAIILDSSIENNFKEITIPTRTLRPIIINVPSGKDSTEFVINELCLISKNLKFKDAIVKLEIQLNGTDLENVQRDKVELYLYNNLEIHNLSNFSESRTISNIQINPEDVFDNTMEITQSINKWVDTRDIFDNETDKNKFRSYAHEIRVEYEEKYNK